jgi:hypothetical protein
MTSSQTFPLSSGLHLVVLAFPETRQQTNHRLRAAEGSMAGTLAPLIHPVNGQGLDC